MSAMLNIAWIYTKAARFEVKSIKTSMAALLFSENEFQCTKISYYIYTNMTILLFSESII